jgi:hypothetical protein
MTQTIHVRFDGKALIPEEPVDLPVGERLTVQLIPQTRPAADDTSPDAIAERIRLLREGAGRIKTAKPIPLEALRRENLYEDDD